MDFCKREKCRQVLVIIICALSLSFPAYAMNVKGREVVIISSYHSTYLWSQQVNFGIIAALTGKRYSGYVSPKNLEISDEYRNSILWMNSKFLTSESEKRKSAQPIIEEIRKRKPDIVIVADDNAAAFVIPHFLNSDILFVFCGINADPRTYGIITTKELEVKNVTGVLERYPFNEIFTLIKQIVPNRSNLYVAYDDTETGRAIKDDFDKTIQSEKTKKLLSRLGFNIKRQLISNNWEEWKKFVLSFQGDTKAIFFVQTFHALVDERNKILNYHDFFSWVRSHSTVPDFGNTGFQVNLGFMATVGTDAVMHGYEAGLVAMKLINGISIQELPVEIATAGAININKTRMRELKVEIPFDILSSAFLYEDPRK